MTIPQKHTAYEPNSELDMARRFVPLVDLTHDDQDRNSHMSDDPNSHHAATDWVEEFSPFGAAASSNGALPTSHLSEHFPYHSVTWRKRHERCRQRTQYARSRTGMNFVGVRRRRSHSGAVNIEFSRKTIDIRNFRSFSFCKIFHFFSSFFDLFLHFLNKIGVGPRWGPANIEASEILETKLKTILFQCWRDPFWVQLHFFENHENDNVKNQH